ncbi:MAG: PHP domain-containing protein, partial [Chloroflexota bacterium]
MTKAFAELHCHTDFSFLDGASPAEDLLERAGELGLSALAVTDHQGLYGAVRFSAAAREAGLHAVVGMEVELLDAAVPDPRGLVAPPPRRRGRGSEPSLPAPRAGEPVRPVVPRQRPPGHRPPRREDLRGVRPRELGPHLTLLARDQAGYASLCRLASAAHLAGTKGVPRFTHELLGQHRAGLLVLTGCRHGELPRRLLAGDREGASEALARLERLVGRDALYVELQHHLLPDDDWLVAELARLAHQAGLPTVVTNDAHYALRSDRELQDVLVSIRHGQDLEAAAHLRRPNAEYALKSGPELAALPPGHAADPLVRHAWLDGIKRAGEVAAGCQVSLEFERYRFPGFPVPGGETPFSYLERLCHDGVRRRYHPITPRVLKQMAHELEVIERTGLAEFFLICWDLMRFARERGIPAQGRGSAGDSIVAYALGITRVDPIRHELLFERFINEGRTTYPDVDIDFASSRREEVIGYVYERYGPEHTGMVCNVVTYRARSAVREVGYALGFPRPLVDRVAKALETYDSVMVRRDLEADGGFAEFFTEPAEGGTGVRQLLDDMGELRRPTADLRRPTADLRRPTADLRRPTADLRPGPTDDEGGPGDTPASEHFLRHEPERRLALVSLAQGGGGNAGEVDGERRILATSVGSIELDPLPPRRRGSTLGLSPWDRWLELCARIDGRPRHLSIHVGGMLVTRAPLVDIAPLEHATMPGRVVVQFDKRDIETMKLIKLDLLGLRMLSAIDDALRDIRADCAVDLDLDRLPEDIEEVFRMIVAADTVGVFQIESRAQMQTLPKSRPATLDDLVVEVAIIRPGPIQGDAVHPYLRRRQGLEPVTYLHPSLEPILAETLGVILYQEQVMKIAIDVAGFSAADSDGFRRAMGTWRSTREMEKLHSGFVDGCVRTSGLKREQAEELFTKVAGFASFGFNKSHAAAFARTAYESAFLKLFYPAQFVTGLINAQPMGFY